MVYCGKLSKGCAPCRAKRTKVRTSEKDTTLSGRGNSGPIPGVFSLKALTLNDTSVTKLDPFAANADGLAENAQVTGLSRMEYFVMRPAKS